MSKPRVGRVTTHIIATLALTCGLIGLAAPAQAARPETPENARFSVGDATSQTVYWDAPSTTSTPPIDEWVVSVLQTGEQTRTFTVPVATQELAVTDLVAGKDVEYSIKARSADGDSPALVANGVTRGKPSAPTNLVGVRANPMTLTWSPPVDTQGFPVDEYRVTVNGTTATLSGSTTSFSFPLTSGTGYNISVTASVFNARQEGAEDRFGPAVSMGPPTAPQNVRLSQPEPGRVILSWDPPADDNGSPIYKYLAKVLAPTVSPWTVVGDGDTRFTEAFNLQPGTTYRIAFLASNQAGPSPSVENTLSLPEFPGAPRLNSVTGGDKSLTVAWDPASAPVSDPVTSYRYSLNGGLSYQEWLDSNGQPGIPPNPFTITKWQNADLVNGQTYRVEMQGENSQGGGIPSNEIQASPVAPAPPEAPTSLSATPINRGVEVSFTEGGPGGSPITNYQYSTDGGTSWQAFAPAQTTSPVTIDGLINGQSYDVALKAVNSGGAGAASTSVPVTPYNPVDPTPPTLGDVTNGDGFSVVEFSAGSGSGNPILSYQYRLNGGSWTEFTPVATGSPVTFSNLTNDQTYSAQLRTVTGYGSSGASNTVQLAPRAPAPTPVPADPPTNLSVVNGNGQVEVSFTPGADNGFPITNYEYSLNDGAAGSWVAFNPARTASPVTITGLTNGQTYQVRLRPVNAAGAGAASAAVTATPEAPTAPPAAPTITSVTAGNGQVTVNFTDGADGGSPITNHRYSTDGGTTWFTFAPAVTGSPAVITGLTNYTPVTIALEAVNSVGTSPASNTRTATPQADVPQPPTLVQGTPGDRQLIISFTAGSDGGSAITNYEYSLNDGAAGSWVAFNPARTASPVAITGLTNGTAYKVKLRAVTRAGSSTGSNTLTLTPVAPPPTPPGPNPPGPTPPGPTPEPPSAPTEVTALPGQLSMTLRWVPPTNTGTAPITTYTATANPGGQTCTTTATTCTITGLTAGVTYTASVTATSKDGTSPASTPSNPVTVSGSPEPPAPDPTPLTPGQWRVFIGDEEAPGAKVTTDRKFNTVTVSAQTVQMQLLSVDSEASVVPLGTSDQLVFPKLGGLSLSGGGFAPNSAAGVYVQRFDSQSRGLTGAQYMGRVDTDSTGELVGGVITGSVPAGNINLIITGPTPSGDILTSEIGVTITRDAPTIVITGKRGKGKNKQYIYVNGTSNDLAGAVVTPHVKLKGQTKYVEGSARRTIAADGTFTWSRKTGKPAYVYFTSNTGVRSNRVVIDGR